MSRLRRMLGRWAVPALIRIACVLALVSLGLTSYGILVPRPIPVMIGSSLGQGLIVLALGAYVLAVVADSMRTEEAQPGRGPAPDDHRR